MKKIIKLLTILLIIPIFFVVSCSTTSDNSISKFTNISFEDKTFVYDGNVHSLQVDGDIPAGIDITYINNDQVNVGVYEVSATLSCEGYETLSLTATLTIKKANIDVCFPDQSYIYDGTEKEISIVGALPEGVTVSYENNKLTDAGEIIASAHFTSVNNNYDLPEVLTAKLTIAKSDYSVSFLDKSYTYDGSMKEITIEDKLPEWIKVRYENNQLTDAGEVLATAHLTSTNPNYSIPKKLTAKLSIQKKDYSVFFRNKTFTYNGTIQEITIDEKLPEWIKVRYENNQLKDAGEILATAHLTSTNPNYSIPEKLTAKLIIEKANINLDFTFSFTDKTFYYDGTEKEIVLNTSLPEYLSVSYENNKLSDSKTVIAKAKITLLDTKNYNKLEKDILEAKLSVVPAANYTINQDGTITITSKLNNYYNSTLIIPESFNGMPIVEISEKAFNYTHHKKVILPETITKIGKSAFANCTELTDINIPNQITIIDDNAFDCCYNLKDIILPKQLLKIGDYSFHHTELSQIQLPNTLTYIGDGAFYGTDLTEVTIPSSVEYVGYEAFIWLGRVYTDSSFMEKWNPSWLSLFGEQSINDIVITSNDDNMFTDTSGLVYRLISYYGTEECEIFDYNGTNPDVIIPASINGYRVRSIAIGAFRNNDLIQSVDISNSNLFEIGYSAFEGCPNLKNVIFPDIDLLIRENAFKNCISLTNVSLLSRMHTDSGVFEGCINLKSVSIHDNIKTINADMFKNCKNLVYVQFPLFLETIYSSAFEGCSKLQDVRFSSSLKNIGSYAFKDCTSLQNVILPNSLTIIEDYAFKGCTSLKDITIPDSVTNIKSQAFENCTSLTHITLSNKLTSIGDRVFKGCTSLQEIIIPSSVINIGYNVFEGCINLMRIYCENPEQPSTWTENWLGYNINPEIIWGYKDPKL